jgi:hypothetical protein
VYQVSERVQLEGSGRGGPGQTPGVKAIYLVRRHADLSDQEAKQRWKEHAPLARQHHVGMDRYVQNGVIRALTPDAPIVNGIAELHFPTLDDLVQRMYGSKEGREAISRDAAGLVAESTVLYTTEHILRI